jgi:branched-chain amino acid transport system permease protein
MIFPTLPDTFVAKHAAKGWPVGIAGVALVIIGSFMSWSFDRHILGDLSVYAYPGGLQILAIILALLALVLLLARAGHEMPER